MASAQPAVRIDSLKKPLASGTLALKGREFLTLTKANSSVCSAQTAPAKSTTMKSDPGPGKAHIRHGHSPWKNGEQQEPPLNPEGYRLPHRIPFLLRTSERQGKSAGHLHSENRSRKVPSTRFCRQCAWKKQQNKKCGSVFPGHENSVWDWQPPCWAIPASCFWMNPRTALTRPASRRCVS